MLVIYIFLTLITMIKSEELLDMPVIPKETIPNVRNLSSSDSAGIQLFVREVTGVSSFQFSPDALVTDIYEQMIPPLNPCKWDLIFRGRKLPIGEALSNCGLSSEVTLGLHPVSPTEQIIRAFENSNLRNILRSEGRDMNDCCSWKNFECNEQKEPITLDFYPISDLELYAEHINFKCLPQSLEEINIVRAHVFNPIDFSGLPSNLQKLNLQHNYMTGTVNLSDLPRTLVDFMISENKFSGTLDFSNLPPVLRTLRLDENEFSGDLDMSVILPSSLEFISLNGNKFDGNVNLNGLTYNSRIVIAMDFRCTSKPFQNKFKDEKWQEIVKSSVFLSEWL